MCYIYIFVLYISKRNEVDSEFVESVNMSDCALGLKRLVKQKYRKGRNNTMDKKISAQSCNTEMKFDDNSYETPDEICLSDGKKSIGDNITKQICNAGGSDLSHSSSCSAGFSADSELEGEEMGDADVTTYRCNSGN